MRKVVDVITNNRMILWGIGLSLLFWIFESVMHVFVFNKGNLLGNIVSPEQHELWMRLLVISLIFSSCVIAQIMINRIRRSENAIKSVYAELDQIFNTVADGMRLIGRDFNILRTNNTFVDLVRMNDKDEVIGKKCYEVFKCPRCHTPECPLKQITGGKERVEFDVEKVRADGTLVSCILTAIPFRGTDGKLIGVVESFFCNV